MSTASIPQRMQFGLARFARLATAASFFVAALALLGWQFDVPFLKSLAPDFVTMKPLTAVCFLACSISLWLRLRVTTSPLSRSLSRILPFSVFLAAAATAFEFLTGKSFAFEELLDSA